MPAITGIIGFGRRLEIASAVELMTKRVIHESFYTSGTYSNEGLGLWIGWANLEGSFSDCMPIWNEKKDICLIFTGEDYIDPAETEKLKAGKHQFTTGDASYLVHLYEDLGDGFFNKLNGRFSGILVNLRENKAILFNDRYGLNRIYFIERAGLFYFSSEAKSLLAALPELRQIDVIALAELFSFGCVMKNRTFYAGLSLIPGGSAWTFRPGQKAVKTRYFDPAELEQQEPLSPTAYFEKLKETWIHILPKYFRSQERLALSLTGGKDSRMILAWAPGQPGSLPCYTFGGTYRDCFDVKIARRVASLSRQPHQVIRLSDSFFKEFSLYAERTIYLTDGNMDVAGSPGLFVNRLARQLAPVRLTGNYGQEILRSSVAFKPSRIFMGILEDGFGRLVQDASHRYQEELSGNRLSFVAFKQVPWHHYARLASELSQLTLRSPYLDNEILSLAFRAPAQFVDRNDLQLRLIAEGNAELGRIETDRGLLNMPVPIYSSLKHQLQEFTFKAEYAYDYGMPHSLAKIDNLFRKLHLERLFLGRHKYYHFRIWYRDQLSKYVKEILLDPRALNRPFLKRHQIEAMIDSHIGGTSNFTIEINRLLSVELIYKQFIDS